MDKSKKTKEKLEASRNKLLDLTRRNRLLNFRAGDPAFEDGKRNSKHLVVEGDFESVWNQLVEREKRIEIKSILSEINGDTYENHLKSNEILGLERIKIPENIRIKINKELKKGNLYSRIEKEALKKRIVKIRAEQNTLSNSTGDSSLFLALGFLEWVEQRSNTNSFAPLCLIHVHINQDLNKKNGNHSFYIQMDVDAPQSNPCLIEKLLRDSQIRIPEFETGNGNNINDYLSEVDHIIKREKDFKIHKTACLGFFNFTKYRLWLDLDAENWPEGSSPADHEIVSSILNAEPLQIYGSMPDEVEVAEMQATDDLPIVTNADSSQYSVLMASDAGKSLTIQGPPGSGKSQTITNLIAVSLNAGKKVLFAAQKLPALQVVQKRLENVGLDPFCLPLFSDKSRASEVHKHIGKTSKFRASQQHRPITKNKVYELAAELNRYVENISEKSIDEDRTISEVLAKANASKLEVTRNWSGLWSDDIFKTIIDLGKKEKIEFNEDWLDDCESCVNRWYKNYLNSSSKWDNWTPTNLSESDASILKGISKDLAGQLDILSILIKEFPSEIEELNFNELLKLFENFSEVSKHKSEVIFPEVVKGIWRNGEERVKVFQDLLKIREINTKETNLEGKLLYNKQRIKEVVFNGLKSIEILIDNFGLKSDLDRSEKHLAQCNTFLKNSQNLFDSIEKFEPLLKHSFVEVFGEQGKFEMTISAVQDFSKLKLDECVYDFEHLKYQEFEDWIVSNQNENFIQETLQLIDVYLNTFYGLASMVDKSLLNEQFFEKISSNRDVLILLIENQIGHLSFGEIFEFQKSVDLFFDNYKRLTFFLNFDYEINEELIGELSLKDIELLGDLEALNKLEAFQIACESNVLPCFDDVLRDIDKISIIVDELSFYESIGVKEISLSNRGLLLDGNGLRSLVADTEKIDSLLQTCRLANSNLSDLEIIILQASNLKKELERLEEIRIMVFSEDPDVKSFNFKDYRNLDGILSEILDRPNLTNSLNVLKLSDEHWMNLLQKTVQSFSEKEKVRSELISEIYLDDLPEDFDVVNTRRELRGFSGNILRWISPGYYRIKSELRKVVRFSNISDEKLLGILDDLGGLDLIHNNFLRLIEECKKGDLLRNDLIDWSEVKFWIDWVNSVNKVGNRFGINNAANLSMKPKNRLEEFRSVVNSIEKYINNDEFSDLVRHFLNTTPKDLVYMDLVVLEQKINNLLSDLNNIKEIFKKYSLKTNKTFGSLLHDLRNVNLFNDKFKELKSLVSDEILFDEKFDSINIIKSQLEFVKVLEMSGINKWAADLLSKRPDFLKGLIGKYQLFKDVSNSAGIFLTNDENISDFLIRDVLSRINFISSKSINELVAGVNQYQAYDLSPAKVIDINESYAYLKNAKVEIERNLNRSLKLFDKEIFVSIKGAIEWIQHCFDLGLSCGFIIGLLKSGNHKKYFDLFNDLSFLCQRIFSSFQDLEIFKDSVVTGCEGDLSLRDIFDRIDMQLSLARSCQSQLRADFEDHSMEFELMRDCYKSLEEVSKLREELSAREEFYGMKLEFLNEQNLKLNCDLVDNINHFPDYICDEFFNGDITLGFEKLLNLYFSLDRVDSAFKKLLNKISLLGKVYGNGPFGLFDKENMETGQISEKNRLFLDNVDSAPAYSARLNDEKEALNLCILELLEFVRKSNKVNLHFLLKSVNYIFDYTVAKSSLKKTKELARFKSSDFELVRENFKNEDRRKIAINKKSIAFKLSKYEIVNGVKGKTVSDHTQFTLLQHEMGKQRRHFPVRQLVQRAGTAMQELCPCWMMTPLSVAQFLPPGKIDFDLVIIDEASQLKPEDAWGIIARGRQVIVVGDQKQMPPSDFFATSSDEYSDIEQDDSEISGGDSESILDASVLSLLSWSLKWHYRSQHESLIAPANNFSYDNNLILFPSPIRDFSEIGVSINYVNGTVTKNKVVNILEAQEIVKRVREILIKQAKKTKSKRLSLGVVTMNIHQQDCINDIIQKMRDDDDEFDSALIEMQSESLPEPFFVRNLENIQGDERDIIIISCTYAPHNEGGSADATFRSTESNRRPKAV